MLRLLGQSEYGLYQLVYSVVSYLSLLSFGFTASYMRFFAKAKMKKDKNEVNRLNGMFLIIFLVIALLCIICGAIMIGNIHIIFSNGLLENEYGTAKILMVLMVLNLAITFPNSVFDSITSAYERFFFQKLLLVLQNILNPFLALPLLIMGYGSIGIVCITTILTVAKLFANIWFVLKKLNVSFCFHGLQFSLLKEMWIFTFFIFLNQIIDQINWSVDKFLLGRFAGTTAVAVYGLGSQINTMYLQFSTSISSVFVPKVHNIVTTSDDSTELTELFTRIGRIQFVILSLIYTGFIFLGKPFMKFWGGEGYSESYYVTLWLIIPATIPLIQNLGLEIQRAKNKHKARSAVYFFIAIANILISIPLIKRLGPTGAAIGTAVSLLIGNGLFMNWYYHNKIGLDMIYYWKNIICLFPALIIPILFGILSINFICYNNMLKLVFGIVLYTIVFAISIFFLGLNKEEKKLFYEPFKKIFESSCLK